jgi:ABC-type glycerol-3-phosphate transport system substrate-binding protein
MKNQTWFCLLTLTVLLVASCKEDNTSIANGSRQSLEIQQTQTKLRWLGQWYGEGKKETLVREIAREFSFLNQDIDVELIFPYEMAGLDSFADPFRNVADSILRWVQTDNWPFDILVCDKWFYTDIATVTGDPDWGQKYLVDFQHEDWYKKAHKDYVLSSDEYKGNFGNIAPGAFIEGAWDLLYVSSDVENKLGIKAKDFDMSIDDFIGYARTIYEYNQTANEKITLCATNYQQLDMVINHLVMTEIGDQQNLSNAEQMKALTNVYQKLEELSKYNPTIQHHTYSTDRELKHDKALFHLHSTWVTMFWQKTNPEGEKLMRPCEFPSMTGKKAHAYSGTYNAIFVVPKKARNRDAAIRLMQYMSSLDIAEKWEKYSKCPTGLKGRISFSEFGDDAFSIFSNHIDQKYQSRLMDAQLPEKMFNGRQKQLNYHVQDVLNRRMTASQAIAGIQGQLR